MFGVNLFLSDHMDLNNVLSRPPRIIIADDDWLNRDLLVTLSHCSRL